MSFHVLSDWKIAANNWNVFFRMMIGTVLAVMPLFKISSSSCSDVVAASLV
jgi:hypothetical protein